MVAKQDPAEGYLITEAEYLLAREQRNRTRNDQEGAQMARATFFCLGLAGIAFGLAFAMLSLCVTGAICFLAALYCEGRVRALGKVVDEKEATMTLWGKKDGGS